MSKTVKYKDILDMRNTGRYGFISILFLLILWVVVSKLNIVSPIFCPTPIDVLKQFYIISTEGYRGHTLFGHIGISMYRVLIGFSIGTILGVIVGMGMGINKYIKGLLDPVIELYRPVPPLAYIPIIIIWLGIGDVSKITLLSLATFALIVINTRAGVKSVSLEKIHAAYALGANNRQVIWHVILINAFPEIFTGMRIAMGVAWGTLVAAEMVASTAGIGWMVLNASRYLRTDIVIMGIFVLGFIGYGFDFLMRSVESKVVHWKGKN
jgi:taurine transport system permease protein